MSCCISIVYPCAAVVSCTYKSAMHSNRGGTRRKEENKGINRNCLANRKGITCPYPHAHCHFAHRTGRALVAILVRSAQQCAVGWRAGPAGIERTFCPDRPSLHLNTCILFPSLSLSLSLSLFVGAVHRKPGCAEVPGGVSVGHLVSTHRGEHTRPVIPMIATTSSSGRQPSRGSLARCEFGGL